MSTLPLKIKVGVRDSWSSSDSNVQKAFAELKGVVGHEIASEPQWAMLWSELSSNFTSADTFVPNLANCVASWARALKDICDNDKNEEFVEELLEKVKHAGNMIRVEIGVEKGDQISTRWSNSTRGFQIIFPKRAGSSMLTLNAVEAKFYNDILGAFKSQASKVSSGNWVGVTNDGDDTDSNFDGASILTPVSTSNFGHDMPIRLPPTKLPDISLLERPEILMAKAPYHLILKSSYQSVTVECSHQASLELISNYLKKWAKTNSNYSTRPPIAKTELRSAAFGLGLMWDTLQIQLQDNDRFNQLNPLLILHFVETVLGYHITHQDVGYWHFRREIDFQ